MSPVTIAFIVFGLVVVIELAYSSKWHRGYMTKGLPIFIRRIERPTGLDGVDLEALQKSAATVAATPLVFQRLEPNLIVFKEKPFGGSIHYFPIMRGVIRRKEDEPSVVVLGLAKYWALALIAGFIALGGRDSIHAAPWILGAFAVLYLIQAVRFGRVAKALRR
jgi:hypothetical protein